MRTALLTLAALLGFAANSLLCRSALGSHSIDPASFTGVRLGAGALTLVLLAGLGDGGIWRRSSWVSGLALFAYAIAFSFAYVRIGAGPGALLLFGCVQLTMIGWGLHRGERPAAREWLGVAVALGGLAVLTLRGASTADALGASLMAVSGVAWGVYSIRGRGTTQALPSTAGNFLRALPFALAASAIAVTGLHLSPRGVLLAALSGALASGVGYSFWYAALPHLSATRAAAVQLAAPVVAALGAVFLLAEPLTPRLLLAGSAIVGGIALVVLGRRTG